MNKETFIATLRRLGDTEIGLIEQASDGLLLLGPKGEKLVEHYSFHAVFVTPEEHRLLCDGRELGSLPIDTPLGPGALLIFAGRRWEVVELRSAERVILVKPASGGKPPKFRGEPGDIHDRVIERMFALFESDAIPIYLDAGAAALLQQARGQFRALGLGETSILRTGEATTWLATRVGTVGGASLALALQDRGFTTERHDGVLKVRSRAGASSIEETLHALAAAPVAKIDAARVSLTFEKHHLHLDDDLRLLDAMSSRLDMSRVGEIATRILRASEPGRTSVNNLMLGHPGRRRWSSVRACPYDWTLNAQTEQELNATSPKAPTFRR